MSRLKLFFATFVTAVGILAMTASPASAHYSSYQGHGCEGWNPRTCWSRSWDGGAYEVLYDGTVAIATGHWHLQAHDTAWGWHDCWVHTHPWGPPPHTNWGEDRACFP